MSSSSELFQAGKLSEAIDAAIADVKASPSDTGIRYFLAELLCISGDLERADRQLDTLFQQADEKAIQVVLVRNLVRAEQARQQFYAEGRLPEFLFDIPDYLRLHLDASIALREGNHAEASSNLSKAEEQRPKPAGTHVAEDDTETAFDDFRDLDDLMAPVLEVLTGSGKYYWLPIDRVRKIEFRAPKRPLDLLWRSVAMDVEDGPQGEVYLPAIYFGGEQTEEQLKLGRGTDWSEPDHGPVRGEGQRTFLCGENDMTIMQLHTLVFNQED